MKHHTIIFVPHARARFRKWRVTNRQLALGVGLGVFVLAASVFTSWAFFTNTIDQAELARIRQENSRLREINLSFESSIRSLGQQLGEFEQRTRQLAIVAGLESLEAGSEAGVGGDGPAASVEFAPELEALSERAGRLSGELERVEGGLDERLDWISSTPAIAPVRGILTSRYGYRSDPLTGGRAFHEGIDIATSPGRPVHAAADGIVVQAGRHAGLGRAVFLAHGFGVTTRYGHLSQVDVEPGQRVERGDVVGRVGSSGRATGYHLHYEVRQDGRSVNPIAYILDSTRDES